MTQRLKQFDIYRVALDPVRGSEQAGTRPCVLLQTNAVGEVASTVLVAPLTSKRVDKVYPYQVLIRVDEKNRLTEDSKLKLDQIRVIDCQRLVEKIGSLEDAYAPAIFEAMDTIFDKWGDFR